MAAQEAKLALSSRVYGLGIMPLGKRIAWCGENLTWASWRRFVSSDCAALNLRAHTV
jgi:hypothetical protein